MYRYNCAAKVAAPAFASTRLLDQVRERIRYLHYSQATEKAYVYWLRYFIRWSGLRHPRDMGRQEVEAFLTMLANERRVSTSTHKQALSAILFLYREVLTQELPWLEEIGRPAQRKRIPAVLTKEEITTVLTLLGGQERLLAQLLYGTGMRLMEGLTLRVKDLDFDRRAIVVREVVQRKGDRGPHATGGIAGQQGGRGARGLQHQLRGPGAGERAPDDAGAAAQVKPGEWRRLTAAPPAQRLSD
ncbi:phage integrase N-terminal SAM-like domain-containing protein [Ramlibacter sp. AN1133]|uniref:phage integrase N-terminal SAM-like domain-containing protein n=1 Tax=Ramlibacter sp. AN1133 TaxID=3133429 RepID=UPI00404070D7